MWRSALSCRSVRRAAEASPQAALAMPLIAPSENVRADNAGRHAGVEGGLVYITPMMPLALRPPK
jgi:hypothetical protein